MGRKLRIFERDAYYHLTSRGNNGEAIVRDDLDCLEACPRCDLDLGEGSAQDLMEKIANAGDRSWFSTAAGCSRVRASAIVRIEVEGRPDTPHDPVER